MAGHLNCQGQVIISSPSTMQKDFMDRGQAGGVYVHRLFLTTFPCTVCVSAS